MNQTLPRARKRFFPALQGVRGAAAVWVVLLHLVSQSYFGPLFEHLVWDPVLNVFRHGYLAVDLFFVLSGFVVCHVYLGSMVRPRLWSVIVFLLHRVGRIFPVHWLILAPYGVAAVTAVLVFDRSIDSQRYSASCFAKSVALVQSWDLPDQPCWNVVAWSVSAEWLAYAAFPLLALLLRQPVKGWVDLAGAVLVSVALVSLLLFTQDGDIGAIVGVVPIYRMAAGFVSGCFLYRAFLAWEFVPGPWRRLAASCAVGAGIACAVNAPLIAILFFPPLVLALAYDSGLVARVLGGRAFLFLGDISYSLYLCHWPLWDVFVRVMAARDVSEVDPANVLLGVTQVGLLVAAMVATAVLIHVVWEQPARRLFRRLGGHLENRP